MQGFDPATSFGPDVAGRYDDHPRGDEAQTVDFLDRYTHRDATSGDADGGRAGQGHAVERTALELAIGTGRIALPLAQRGVRVDGIELSPDMVAAMRAKPGGADLRVTIGDMAEVRAPGERYPLVYLVFNTIYNLLTQQAQVRCFENAARHLTDNGVFVVEAGVPSAWLRGDQFVDVERVTTDEVVLDVNRYDPVTQILDENHVSLTSGGVRMGPISCRLIWPGEMDLMARIAGLRLVNRWAGWRDEPFTSDSKRHISVYAR
ncbi:class I SAM-dependent DNA methyltransferase [Nakamurella lactea]|uniref:class I SAM-dependent DNA methyltransferase n=1 Tax=Nakamurella lactea TaxID=459515 RepID=UPI000415847F|nr:class I SAM-dependent methyltransferase [Nakamurella lactea]